MRGKGSITSSTMPPTNVQMCPSSNAADRQGVTTCRGDTGLQDHRQRSIPASSITTRTECDCCRINTNQQNKINQSATLSRRMPPPRNTRNHKKNTSRHAHVYRCSPQSTSAAASLLREASPRHATSCTLKRSLGMRRDTKLKPKKELRSLVLLAGWTGDALHDRCAPPNQRQPRTPMPAVPSLTAPSASSLQLPKYKTRTKIVEYRQTETDRETDKADNTHPKNIHLSQFQAPHLLAIPSEAERAPTNQVKKKAGASLSIVSILTCIVGKSTRWQHILRTSYQNMHSRHPVTFARPQTNLSSHVGNGKHIPTRDCLA